MSNIIERQNDILAVISQLDISPTMYKNADEKYHTLAAFLEDCGIEAEIYPHGSFALGTVIRPSAEDPDAAYDLDFICQINLTRDQISPVKLREELENALKSNERYSSKLTNYEECFTIEYADINGISFNIDIVPAVSETVLRKQELMAKSANPELLQTAIAIPRQNKKLGDNWLTNNPRGFQKWFEEINQPFLLFNRDDRLQTLLRENQKIFNSVDEIPIGLERSAMQRVIQILKLHRDMFYLKYAEKDANELKPISAIINTLVASIAKSAIPYLTTFDLLKYVLNELKIYAYLQSMRYEQFRISYGDRTAIKRTHCNNEWIIQNPADPEDNLADKWNENPDIPILFFVWINACEKDFLQSLSLPDYQFRTVMENAFGTDTIQKNWSNKYKTKIRAAPKSIEQSSKPYCKNDR